MLSSRPSVPFRRIGGFVDQAFLLRVLLVVLGYLAGSIPVADLLP